MKTETPQTIGDYEKGKGIAISQAKKTELPEGQWMRNKQTWFQKQQVETDMYHVGVDHFRHQNIKGRASQKNEHKTRPKRLETELWMSNANPLMTMGCSSQLKCSRLLGLRH